MPSTNPTSLHGLATPVAATAPLITYKTHRGGDPAGRSGGADRDGRRRDRAAPAGLERRVSADRDVRLPLSAGRGPQEWAWAVTELLHRLEREAARLGVRVARLYEVPGAVRSTHRSVSLHLGGSGALRFVRSWSGTLCWQAPSLYRPGVGRKNWYVVAGSKGPTPTAPFSSRTTRTWWRAAGRSWGPVPRQSQHRGASHLPPHAGRGRH